MKILNLFVFLLTASLIFISCKNFVTNVDPLVSEVEDSRLNDEAQIPFVAAGVETRFAYAIGQTDVCSAGLSDAFFFDSNVPSATYPSFESIDAGNMSLNNGSGNESYNTVGQFRFYADDLIRRANSISYSDLTVKNNALFIGYFYGG